MIINNFAIQPSLSDLTTNVTNEAFYPVPSQVVFVSDTKKFYNLNVGVDGTQTAHWTDLQLEVTSFPEYNSANAYVVGNAVKVGTTFYLCVADASVGESPSTNPSKWAVVQSAVPSLVTSFTSVDAVTINHTLNLTTVAVYVDISGTLTKVDAHIELPSATQVIVNFATAQTGEVRMH